MPRVASDLEVFHLLSALGFAASLYTAVDRTLSRYFADGWVAPMASAAIVSLLCCVRIAEGLPLTTTDRLRRRLLVLALRALLAFLVLLSARAAVPMDPTVWIPAMSSAVVLLQLQLLLLCQNRDDGRNRLATALLMLILTAVFCSLVSTTTVGYTTTVTWYWFTWGAVLAVTLTSLYALVSLMVAPRHTATATNPNASLSASVPPPGL